MKSKIQNQLILLIGLFVIMSCSCKKDSNIPVSSSDRCIDTTKINPDSCCFTIYEPVCGCDSITYANACKAENNGVLYWTEGACASDTTAQNLIINESFECNGKPVTVGWDGYVLDDSTDIVQDAPPNGGIWSFWLGATWIPWGEWAETYITGQSGTNIYQLEAWMKSETGWKGSLTIGVLEQKGQFFPSQLTQEKEIFDKPISNIWAKYTLTDTISTQPTDTIVVRISAGGCQNCYDMKTYFDLIKLIKLK
ncbi:MAG: hypothetical protein FVQ77_11740 [Cytophagales bacterium]|nr:hypothetical protein [Cytophagales bacterium]